MAETKDEMIEMQKQKAVETTLMKPCLKSATFMKTPWHKLIDHNHHAEAVIVSSEKPCDSHNLSRLGYVAKSDNAEMKLKQGHLQKQCDACGRWYFKCEY